MEKPAVTPVYRPPLTHTSSIAPSHAPGNIAATRWQATERTSFESALNRIRDRNDQSEHVNSSAKAKGSENLTDITADLVDEESVEVTEEVSDDLPGAEEQPVIGAQSTAQRMGSSLNTELSETLTIDMAQGGAELPGGVLIDGMAGESAGATHGSTQPSAAGGTFTAETVAQMMTRMERTAGTHNGQWSFGVLNDQAGVTALQLQRSLQGGWRVNVSFNEAAQIDEQKTADELKDALRREGHDVDSVVISRLASHLALDD